MKKVIYLAVLLAAMIGCKQQPKEQPPKVDSELNELFAMMQGSFNSQAQAEKDSSYFNISLHMYPIWKDQGNFLYVEQALNSAQDRPYRQRVYEVKRLDDTTIGSYVYTLPNDSIWVGKWKTPDSFDQLTYQDIRERKGCEVLLKRKSDGSFEGATDDYSCESTLRGASYATSEVKISKGRIDSWDRGFDAEGHQVWGAEKGGYEFIKIK